MLEFTVPWEDRTEQSNKRKMNKKKYLVVDSQLRDRCVWYIPVKVGCQCFVRQFMRRSLQIVGVTGTVRRWLIRSLGRKAEMASVWVWCWYGRSKESIEKINTKTLSVKEWTLSVLQLRQKFFMAGTWSPQSMHLLGCINANFRNYKRIRLIMNLLTSKCIQASIFTVS